MANKDEQQTNAPAMDPKDAEIEKLKKLLKESEKKASASEAALADLQAAQEKATEAVAKNTDKVTIKLYKDQNIKDDVQVFVNGRQYIIKRGVSVDVPREVFEVLQNQEKMRDHIAAYNEKHEQK